MTSQRDAQIHIERIRSELNPDGHPKLALLIKNALEMLVHCIKMYFAGFADILPQRGKRTIR